MEEPDLSAKLLPTPFVSSWIGRARMADTCVPDPGRRAGAWAHWAFTSMQQMTGRGDRPYIAMTLPGRFYDPRGTGPAGPPHLEVPATLFERPDAEFPDRLAQIGNGLLFQWWIRAEVMAVKRALFNTGRGPIADLVELLNDRRAALVETLAPLSAAAGRRWSVLEGLQVSDPAGVSEAATAAFETAEVNDFLPAAAPLHLRIEFDEKLREDNRSWASRRVGVWRISGVTAAGEPFTLGVVTPRLTRSSMFSDPLFDPATESSAALLVRGLLLRRLLRTQLGEAVEASVGDTDPQRAATSGAWLRAVVARGAKVPEASVASAVHFLQTYPDAADAWAALTTWANTRPAGSDSRRATLTVTEEGFTAAHRGAYRALRRAEDPERDDINVILPVAWDYRARPVRVTFSRPTPEDCED